MLDSSKNVNYKQALEISLRKADRVSYIWITKCVKGKVTNLKSVTNVTTTVDDYGNDTEDDYDRNNNETSIQDYDCQNFNRKFKLKNWAKLLV
jgi:hypothetical protein